MAEPDDITAPIQPVRGGARRVRWPIALVLVWAALGIADVAVFHIGPVSSDAAVTKPAATSGVAGHRHGVASAPSHPAPLGTASSAHPTATARVLIPVSASAFGPGGLGSGDNPQTAPMAIDASAATSWTTQWYRSARFGNLKDGTGLLIDMGHPVTITRARILLGGASGADLQLLTGNVPELADLHARASARDAGVRLRLHMTAPQRARYLLIWFTSLPPDSAGTFQVSVYNVSLAGTP